MSRSCSTANIATGWCVWSGVLMTTASSPGSCTSSRKSTNTFASGKSRCAAARCSRSTSHSATTRSLRTAIRLSRPRPPTPTTPVWIGSSRPSGPRRGRLAQAGRASAPPAMAAVRRNDRRVVPMPRDDRAAGRRPRSLLRAGLGLRDQVLDGGLEFLAADVHLPDHTLVIEHEDARERIDVPRAADRSRRVAVVEGAPGDGSFLRALLTFVVVLLAVGVDPDQRERLALQFFHERPLVRHHLPAGASPEAVEVEDDDLALVVAELERDAVHVLADDLGRRAADLQVAHRVELAARDVADLLVADHDVRVIGRDLLEHLLALLLVLLALREHQARDALGGLARVRVDDLLQQGVDGLDAHVAQPWHQRLDAARASVVVGQQFDDGRALRLGQVHRHRRAQCFEPDLVVVAGRDREDLVDERLGPLLELAVGAVPCALAVLLGQLLDRREVLLQLVLQFLVLPLQRTDLLGSPSGRVLCRREAREEGGEQRRADWCHLESSVPVVAGDGQLTTRRTGRLPARCATSG